MRNNAAVTLFLSTVLAVNVWAETKNDYGSSVIERYHKLQNERVYGNILKPKNPTEMITLDDGFMKELYEFYSSSRFSSWYSDFMSQLSREGALSLTPVHETYIRKILAEVVDKKTFSLTIYLIYEDQSGNQILIPSKYIASRSGGSPKRNLVKYPDRGWVDVPIENETNAFSLYDIALFGLLKYESDR